MRTGWQRLSWAVAASLCASAFACVDLGALSGDDEPPAPTPPGCGAACEDAASDAPPVVPDASIVSEGGAASGTPLYLDLFQISGRKTVDGIAVNAAGEAAMIGNYENTIDFGKGILTDGYVSFVARFDKQGKALWSRRIGRPAASMSSNDFLDPQRVAMDTAGNVYVTGIYTGDTDLGLGPLPNHVWSGFPRFAFLVRYDAMTGSPKWQRLLGPVPVDGGVGGAPGGSTTQIAMNGLAFDPSNGTLLVGGTFSGNYDLAAGVTRASTLDGSSQPTQDAFVMRVDTAGDPVESITFGGVGTDTLTSLAVNASGQIAITGSFATSLSVGGTSVTSVGLQADVYAATLAEPKLTTTWATAMGSDGYDRALDVSIGPSGDVAVTGLFSKSGKFGSAMLVSKQDSEDLFVAKLGPTGTILWARAYGGSSPDESAGVALAGDGSVVVAGGFYGSIDLGAGPEPGATYTPYSPGAPFPNNTPTGFAIALDTSGSRLWSKTYGKGLSPLAAVRRSADGTVFIAGRFTGTASFDGRSVESIGMSDIFLASYTR